MAKPPPSRRVPAFTPVPLRYRSDGWTPGRQSDFLGRLAETGKVAAAARHVGMTRESAYRLRDRPGAASFAAAWDKILAQRPSAPMSTTSLLWHRMYYGTLKPIMRAESMSRPAIPLTTTPSSSSTARRCAAAAGFATGAKVTGEIRG